MKKPLILFAVVTFITASYFVLQRDLFTKPVDKDQSIKKEEEIKQKETGAEKQLAMWFHSKGYPNPNNLNDKYQAGWQQYLELKKKRTKYESRITAANWTSLGDVSTIGGRILCIAIDPNNSNNLWAGSASGGIWKSVNAGTSWTSVTTNLQVLGVSSILVDPSNSNVIYAGTGEVYRVDTSNIGFNVWKTRGTYGIGIIKSTNGGANWSQVMTKTTDQLFAIQMLKFDPTNSNTIYACATDGLYRSVDNGTNWSQILSKIYVSDVAINPSNTDQIVVGVGNMVNSDKGIYRTTNGSSATPSWVKITTGLPASFMGYIRFAKSGASNLYASIGLNGTTSGDELYQSTNFGSTWSAKTGSNHCNYQHWFAHDVAVNPNNTDQLLICGVSWYRYTSSTSTRTGVTTPGHADVHDIVYDPNVANRVYVTHDGGISVSNDGGATFSDRNSGIRATQFYASFGVHPTNANIMIGGLQDNGVVRYNGATWATAFGGDGGACFIAPNGTTVLASNDARSVRRSTTGTTGAFGSVLASWAFTGDDRTAFMAPVAISKSDGNYMYVASDNIHRSTTGGASGSWSNSAMSSTNYIEQQRKTAIAIAVSPTNRDKIYVSTSPIAQNTTSDYLWVNGQPNIFKTTTPATTPYSSIKGSLPDRFVMDFAISSNNDDSVYVVMGGFGTSHVYLTPDGGTTWISRGAGLPDVPFNAIVIDPVNKSTIYAGCDFGVYVSPDRGQTWIDFNGGFWDATLVMDLQIDANNKLIAATHGKGVFRSDLYDNSVLPATLLDFSGSGFPGYNRLQWKVAQEQDLDHYELERSTDGSVFAKVATVQSQNQTAVTNYSQQDNTTLFESYYRLKLVDMDGMFTYSSVVFIRKINVKNEFHVLGNPFHSEIVVKYKLSNNQDIHVQLMNVNGALIRKQEYAATAGTGIYTISGFQQLASGIYFLKIEGGDDRQTIRLVKN